MLPIYDVSPFTLLDFTGKTACIIWFSGCNMRCVYCHNPQIVKGKGKWSQADVLHFLKKRQGLLDGVVLSGGEATLYPDIIDFTHQVKELGYAVKLDTNGTRPDLVQQLIDKKLLDYVALDYKAPVSGYFQVTGTRLYPAFNKTLSLLCRQSAVKFEVRTTVHTALLNEDDIIEMINFLSANQYKGTYYIQNYIHHTVCLKAIPEQTRKLDISRLPKPQGFDIQMRNF